MFKPPPPPTPMECCPLPSKPRDWKETLFLAKDNGLYILQRNNCLKQQFNNEKLITFLAAIAALELYTWQCRSVHRPVSRSVKCFKSACNDNMLMCYALWYALCIVCIVSLCIIMI